MAEFGSQLVRRVALTPVTRGVRASLDAGGRRGESMDMENRMAVLERDVHAIKSELAVIRREHDDAKELGGRLRQMDVDLATIKTDSTQLQKSVSQLAADVVQLKEEVVLISVGLARLQAECATKADVGNLKGWMLGIALTVLSLNFGMNVVFFNAQKMTPVPQPTHALQAIPSEKASTEILR